MQMPPLPDDSVHDAPLGLSEQKAATRSRVRAGRRERRQHEGAAGRDADAQALAHIAMDWLRTFVSTEQTPAPGTPRAAGTLQSCCVTAYESMASEPPFWAFIAAAQQAGVRVLVPITLGEGRLRWREVDPTRSEDPMRPSTDHHGLDWGSEVLGEVDVAFIPATAIGPDGTRLGQGGGYYDRTIPTLRSLRADTPVIAVVYEQDFGAHVPTEGHDITVDAVLTPTRLAWVTPPAATSG